MPTGIIDFCTRWLRSAATIQALPRTLSPNHKYAVHYFSLTYIDRRLVMVRQYVPGVTRIVPPDHPQIYGEEAGGISGYGVEVKTPVVPSVVGTWPQGFSLGIWWGNFWIYIFMPRLLAAEYRMITPTTLRFIWWKLIIPTLHPNS